MSSVAGADGAAYHESPLRNLRIPAKPKTTDALKILDRLTGDDNELRELIERETINAEVARLIHDARATAGLTQQQLAALAGTRQPNIARLEDAGYDGHSLTMLQRIAKALNQRLEIKFRPLAARRKAS